MKGTGKRRSEDGFNLVVLAVMFMVMNILLAKALPLWSTQIQRQKEADLIFRGLQYAEAIRVFQARFNRAPVRLQELIEVEPRCIRQLWNNPLSPEALGQPPAAIGWEPIFEGQPDAPGQPGQRGDRGQGGRDQRGRDQGFQRNGGETDEPRSSRRRFGEQEEVKVGPILGVRSQVGDTAVKMFFDTDAVPEWKFTTGCFQVRMRAGGEQPMPINASEIGRPWPPNIQPLNAVQSCEPVRQRQTRGRNLGGNQRPGQPQPGAPARGQTLNPPSRRGGRQQ